MKHRKVLVTLVIATLILFGFIGIASAHTPSVSPSCSGLSVSLVSYEGPATNNRLQVSLDGVPTVTLFGTSFSKSYTFTKDVPSHTWMVVIDANLESGNPTQFDKTFTGVQQPCESATTTTPTSSSIPSTTSVPTTTVPTATTQPSTTTAVTTTAASSTSSTATPTVPAASEPSTTSPASPVPTTRGPALPADAGLPNDCDVNQTTGRGTYSDGQPCGPATILDSYPTTTDVAVAAPPVRSFGPAVKLPATGTDLSDVGQSLPVTGSETNVMLGIALALAAAGAGLVAVARIHRGKS